MRKNQPTETATSGVNDLDRRSFVKIVPALSAAGLLAMNSALQVAAQAPSALPSPTPSPTPAQPSPLAEAYVQVARVRFGEHAKPEQWERIRTDLEGNVRTADRLRGSKLKNGDEPDFIFVA